MGSNTNKSPLQTQAEDMATNLPDVLPETAEIPFEGEKLTPAQAVAELQAGLGTITDAANQKQAYATAVAAKKAGVANLRALVGAIEAYLRVMIPTDTAGLASCGIEPKKQRAQLTSAEKAAAAAQAAATRKANGVQGSKQKRKAALAAKATTVVLGADGQPLDGSVLPSSSNTATPAPAASSPAPSGAGAAGK
jgi:hypothetical protein